VDGKEWLSALLGDDLVAVRLRVREPDVVFVKGIVEASEGVGAVFAEPRQFGAAGHDGGKLVFAAPRSRAKELHDLIDDLHEELGGALWRESGE
jgi:hypothetical protein